MSLKKLSEKEAVELVISILKEAGKPLTTREIEEENRKRMAYCPDKTPIFLNKLRIKGIIEGQLSAEILAGFLIFFIIFYFHLLPHHSYFCSSK